MIPPATSPSPYLPADTDWFAKCRLGVSAHWTAKSAPLRGPPLPFQQAVAAFDVARFIGQLRDAGASYLVFTVTHALQCLPAPVAAVDRILPHRTCQRDLLGELAEGCSANGLHLLLYYNHSCNQGNDPAWERAVGYHDADKSRLTDNLFAIVQELGGRYGSAIRAWWFDSAYSLDPTGPYSSVSTDMCSFRFPWEDFSAVAKVGFPQRLVCFNPGFGRFMLHRYSASQDYLAGEQLDLSDPPTGRIASNGLQNHRWFCLDNAAWVHDQPGTPFPPVRFGIAELRAYLDQAHRCRSPVTCNVDIEQGGLLNPEAIRMLAAAG